MPISPTTGGQAESRERLWLLVAAAAAALSAILALTPLAPAIPALVGGAGVAVWLGRKARAQANEAAQAAAVAPVASALGYGPAAPAAQLASAVEVMARSAEAARSQASSSQRIVEALDDPLVVTDGAGIVTLANEAAQRLIGTRRAATVGRPIDELFTQADLLGLHARAAKGSAVRSRVSVQGPSGARVLEVSAIPLRPEAPGEGVAGSAAGGGTLLALRDVTDLASAVHVRTDFVANASHELRTPVAAVRGAVDTMLAGADDDPAIRSRMLDMIANHVGRLEDLIRDLLDLSRLEAMEGAARIGPAPGSEIVRLLEPAFEELCARREVTLSFEIDDALEHMRTDRNLLTLILRNLIENAVKFSKPGGSVQVIGRPATIERESAAPAPGVRFEVIDSGVGIPLNQQQRIFERFYQVDEARTGSAGGDTRGTGLGLAIVKHAVRTLGGGIRVRSVWQQGTTMTVELPGALGAAASPTGRPAAAAG
jgi:two-component system phosphate regulon sensor histidine kinase PhoR